MELLLRQLYDAGSTHSRAADTVPPTSSAEAVARAGGVVLRDGLRAVLESETGLRRISRTRRKIARDLEDLPLPDGTSSVHVADLPPA
jgi:hypothetical protein